MEISQKTYDKIWISFLEWQAEKEFYKQVIKEHFGWLVAPEVEEDCEWDILKQKDE